MSILKFVVLAGVLTRCCIAVDISSSGIQEGTAVTQPSGVASKGTVDPVPVDGETRQSYNGGSPAYGLQLGAGQNKRRCPLCDSSVYPYCGDKLLHDACCCTDPYSYQLPNQCRLADCAFLHSNSCREHRLIANCCCSDQYRSLLRG